jgi:hypothetical protein
MCLINALKPKFVRFKLSNRNLRTTAKVKKFRRHLLLVEYEEKQKQAKKLGKELDQMKKENHLYMFDLYYRLKLIIPFKNLEKYETERIKDAHEIKLSKLLGGACDHNQSSLLEMNKLE